MGNALFIVWRESVEAILVVGILYAWIRENSSASVKLRHLWWGVAGGIGAASLLAVAMLSVQTQLAGAALDAFQAMIVLAAAALITHMVLWMRRYGPHIKRDLEAGLQHAASTSGAGLSAALLAAVAVAREGAETVLFLYGLGVERRGAELASLLSGAAFGFVLALLTAWLIAKGRQLISWRAFFRFTEILLLLLAAALLTSGIERMISLEWLPALADPLFDVSAMLDEGSAIGGIGASFTGYRARPPLSAVLAYVAYWVVVWWLMARLRPAFLPKAPLPLQG